MSLRDRVHTSPTVNIFLVSSKGVLVESTKPDIFFEKFNSLEELCQLFNHIYTDITPASKVRLFPSKDSVMRYLNAYRTNAAVFEELKSAQAYTVTTTSYLTNKSFEEFIQKKQNKSEPNKNILVSSVDLQYVLVNEYSKKILYYGSRFYTEDVKLFYSNFVFRCGTSIDEARDIQKRILNTSLPDVRDIVQPCVPYLRVTETAIGHCSIL